MFRNVMVNVKHKNDVVKFFWALFTSVTICINFAKGASISGLIKTNYNDPFAFELTIIHFNDFHARFQEISPKSTACKVDMTNCIGGISRMQTEIHALLDTSKNAIVLNAGDNFQGTPWYTLYKWNVTQYFLNMLPVDVTTLGNHEFDDGIDGLLPFIQRLKSPMVIANMDTRNEPKLDTWTRPSHVFERGGKRIGVVGVIYKTVPESSRTGGLIFTDEIEAVKNEAQRLKEVDKCDIIIVLSHCGISIDQEIAKNGGPHISVIVGGHSHTLLYHGSEYPGVDPPQGDYPIVITQDGGHQVLVVQALCFSKFLGNITLLYDRNNQLVHWEGNPIYLDKSIAKDPTMDKELMVWEESLDDLTKKVIGQTKVELKVEDCWFGECNLGNLIADSMVFNWINDGSNPAKKGWTSSSLAMMHSGGIRLGLEENTNITLEDVLIVLPYGGSIDLIELRGDHILEAFEHAFSQEYYHDDIVPDEKGIFNPKWPLQVSGFQVIYNVTKPPGQRVMQLLVRCSDCDMPSYSPIQNNQYYRVTASEYLLTGGDGFTMLTQNTKNHITGPLDAEVLVNYIKRVTPIIQGVEGRTVVLY